MLMDPKLSGYSDYGNGFGFGDDVDAMFTRSDQYSNGFNFDISSPDLSFIDGLLVSPESESVDFPPSVSVSSGSDESLNFVSSGWSSQGISSSPSGDGGYSDPVPTDPYLKRISQMLMEENMADELWDDSFALIDTEQSLYEVIGEQYPPRINQPRLVDVECPDSNISGNGSECGSHSHTSPSNSTGSENLWGGDVVDHNLSQLQVPLSREYHLRSNSNHTSPQFSVNSTNGLSNMDNGLMEASSTEFMVKNMFSDANSILQFQRGLEEASKFLPSGDKLIIAPGSSTFSTNRSMNAVVKEQKNERQRSPDGSRVKNHHEREDSDIDEERRMKQSASFVDESELHEMFDKVLLLNCENNTSEDVRNGVSKTSQKNGHSHDSKGGKTKSKRRGKQKEAVDLRALLVLCAQAISSYDQRTASELLKQIREHSSPDGNGSQRLAHYFANGLEARLEGSTRVKSIYPSLMSRKFSAAEALNAFKVSFNACPFKKLALGFANKMICNIVEKATSLHIVDFGILYGFQWPLLIQLLSMRPGGPPKLRITGIDLPESGFRPTERLEETGRRLAKYCERFNVPFEYNSIAVQKWETIQLEDLKFDRNEILAVNNNFRFEDLLDETEDLECPRDALLKLIRSMNPAIFAHSVFSGSYNAPFFLTRFKEALFYFSSVYDLFDTNISHEEPARKVIESEAHGRAVMNVIACEGIDRVHRPETYKQWNYRNIRAGFKSLPLDQELMRIIRDKTRSDYHPDFVFDEDKHWMLQGWKGRILFASSCWVPA